MYAIRCSPLGADIAAARRRRLLAPGPGPGSRSAHGQDDGHHHCDSAPTPHHRPSSERRPDRKLKRAERLALPRGRGSNHSPPGSARTATAIGCPDPAAYRRSVRSNVRAEPVHVADVEEGRHPEVEGQRDDVLDVAQHLRAAADLVADVVDRRDLTELEAADRVRATQVEALVDRDRIPRPSPRPAPPPAGPARMWPARSARSTLAEATVLHELRRRPRGRRSRR